MNKHTPGPWICYADLPSTEPNWHIVTTANKMRVLANVHIEPGNAMDEANARLITAAPELFTQLKVAEAFMAGFEGDKTQDGIDDHLRTIRDAIAKVEGR